MSKKRKWTYESVHAEALKYSTRYTFALASKGAVLSAEVVPPEGGQTEWADMRAAYDELDQEMKDRIADLSAYHSLFYSQAQIGHKVAVGAGYGFDNDTGHPFRPLVI